MVTLVLFEGGFKHVKIFSSFAIFVTWNFGLNLDSYNINWLLIKGGLKIKGCTLCFKAVLDYNSIRQSQMDRIETPLELGSLDILMFLQCV